jgi:hypothetical protein
MLLNKKRDWIIFGLLLQIPNAVILLSLFFSYGIDFFINNVQLIYLIVGGSILALINIFSIIFLIVGIATKNRPIIIEDKPYEELMYNGIK